MTPLTYEDALPYLDDMIHHGKIAIKFAEGRQLPDLQSDLQYRFSVLYALQVIGEAATKVPTQVRSKAPTIPWPLITGLRHTVVHAYGTVKLDVIQSVLEDDMQPLLESLNDLRFAITQLGKKPLLGEDE